MELFPHQSKVFMMSNSTPIQSIQQHITVQINLYRKNGFSTKTEETQYGNNSTTDSTPWRMKILCLFAGGMPSYPVPRETCRARLGSAPRPTDYAPPPVDTTEHGLVLTDRAHTEAFVAVEVVHAAVERDEVEAPRVVRAAGVERPRPVVTAGVWVVELRVPAAAGGGQEERRAVLLRGEEAAFSRPFVVSVFQQLLPLVVGGRAPAAAPVGSSWVIACLQGPSGCR